MTPASPRSTLFVLLAGIAATRAISLYCFYLYDDAFITFRFVENLVSGQGFVYNIGHRVQGITTPLWGFLLALPSLNGWPLESAARWLAIGFDLLTATLLFHHLRARGLLLAGMLILFLFGLDLYLAKTAVGGMESSLFLLLTVGSALAVLSGQLHVAAVLAALSVFVRPEGLIFALCLLAYARLKTEDFRWSAVWMGAAIIALGAYWQYSYYGDWIPQSVRGKMALPANHTDIFELALFPLRDPLQCLLTIATVYFLPSAWRRSEFVKIYSIWSLTLLLTWLVSGAHLWSWYVVPVWFWKVVVVGTGLGIVASRVAKTRQSEVALLRLLPTLALTLTAATIVVWSAFALFFGRDRLEAHVYSKIRDWAAGQDFSNQRAYGMDFGAFGYYTGMTILDEPGLVWPPAITRYHSRLDSILIHEKPNYAFVTATQDNIAVMRAEPFVTTYTPLWRASMYGDTSRSAPLESFVSDWAADFILYRRVHAEP
jgi:hypothetical protein